MLSAAKAYLSAQVGDRVRHAARSAVLLALAGLFILIGLLFALFALYQYGAAEIGPIPAAWLMAGGLVVLALVLVAIARLGGRAPRPAQPAHQALADDAIAALGLNDERTRNKLLYQTLAAALLAGFYAGRKTG